MKIEILKSAEGNEQKQNKSAILLTTKSRHLNLKKLLKKRVTNKLIELQKVSNSMENYAVPKNWTNIFSHLN